MKRKEIISILSIILVGEIMLCLSWQKWADVLIDFGREMYLPWQINQGRVLYRDILHLYGPFSHYFNSFLFRIFGTHLMTLAIFNIILTGVLTTLIYLIFRRISNLITATTVCVVFLSMFAFSQYVGIANYNYVCPYSHEMTHGLLLSFFSIYCFTSYLKRRESPRLFLMGLSLGLAALTKVEVFLAISLAQVSGLLFVVAIVKPRREEILKIFGVFFLAFVLPIFSFLIYFSYCMPFKSAIESILFQYKIVFATKIPSNIFYLHVLGFDEPLSNLTRLFMAASFYIAVPLFFGLLSFMKSRIPNEKLKSAFTPLAFGTIIFFIPLIIKKVPWPDIFRPLPLVMATFGIYLFATILRYRHEPQKTFSLLPIFVLTIFGFTLLLKMILNVHIYHFGFALSMPAALMLIMMTSYQLPNALGRLFGDRTFTQTLSLLLIVIAIIAHVRWSKSIYDFKIYPVGSGGDTIMAAPPTIDPRGLYVNAALFKIKEIVREGETFIVFPDSVILNYLARRPNPSPYFELTPPMVTMLGEGRIVGSLAKTLPDYIIIVYRDTSEHGPSRFGVSYCIKVFSWIKEHYAPIYQIGNSLFGSNGLGILIFKHKSRP